MHRKLNKEEMRDLYTWIDKIPLSRPKRHITRDFSDGVMAAEVVKHFFPKLVDLHNYVPTNSTQQKHSNWDCLDRKVFSKLNFHVPKETVSRIVQNTAGVIEPILSTLKMKIQRQLEHTTGSTLDLENNETRDQKTKIHQIEVKHLAQNAGGEMQNDEKSRLNNGKLEEHMVPLYTFTAVKEILSQKEQAFMTLQVTMEILEMKMSRLERLVQLKDMRIEELRQSLETYKAKGNTQSANKGSNSKETDIALKKMERKLNKEELRDLCTWIDKIPLSRPIRHITRDFSDGVMAAEVVQHFFPKLVDLHNYVPASSTQQKHSNWDCLNRKVFSKLNFHVPKETVRRIVLNIAGVIEPVLSTLREMLQKRLGHTAENILDLKNNETRDQIHPQTEIDQIQVKRLAQSAGGEMQNYEKSGIQNGDLEDTEVQFYTDIDPAIQLILQQEQQAVVDLREIVKTLQMKVSRLERLVQLKDTRIEELRQSLETYKAKGNTQTHATNKRLYVQVPKQTFTRRQETDVTLKAMDRKLTQQELQDLYAWMDKIPLSRPKRHITRDFSDGVMAAEVVKHFFPKLVDMHNYVPANSTQQKHSNWDCLDRKVFSKLNFHVPKETVSRIVLNTAGVIEPILSALREKLEKASENILAPENRR